MGVTTSSATDSPGVIHRHGFLKRVVYWILNLDDEATHERGRRRLRNARRFLPSLTQEQLQMIGNYKGSEKLGPPLIRRERRDLARRMAAWSQQ